MTKKDKETSGPIIIKKYANRRLYNTATSSYVTLDDLSKMVKEGAEFVVQDAKTNEDITRSVLTQIIFEEESNGAQNLLPINFLRQLIKFYGDNMQALVPNYLDFSMDNFLKEQDKFRQQFFSGTPFNSAPITQTFQPFEDLAKKNVEIFGEAVKNFYAMTGMTPPNASSAGTGVSTTSSRSDTDQDLKKIKEEMASLQEKLEKLGKNNS